MPNVAQYIFCDLYLYTIGPYSGASSCPHQLTAAPAAVSPIDAYAVKTPLIDIGPNPPSPTSGSAFSRVHPGSSVVQSPAGQNLAPDRGSHGSENPSTEIFSKSYLNSPDNNCSRPCPLRTYFLRCSPCCRSHPMRCIAHLISENSGHRYLSLLRR